MSGTQSHTIDSPSAPLPRADRPRRRWLTVLLGLLIFGMGFASGAGVAVYGVVHRLQHAIQHPEVAPQRAAALLKRKLSLDDRQTALVEEIVARRQVEILRIRKKFQPEIVSQLEQLRTEIGNTLSADQRTKWDAMFEDLSRRWLPSIPEENN
ncbi:MAG: hypothetical protein IT425_14490 [Pirellulales bacterium]|nr:hypothetical protein [Pirellulales bacterium]